MLYKCLLLFALQMYIVLQKKCKIPSNLAVETLWHFSHFFNQFCKFSQKPELLQSMESYNMNFEKVPLV